MFSTDSTARDHSCPAATVRLHTAAHQRPNGGSRLRLSRIHLLRAPARSATLNVTNSIFRLPRASALANDTSTTQKPTVFEKTGHRGVDGRPASHPSETPIGSRHLASSCGNQRPTAAFRGDRCVRCHCQGPVSNSVLDDTDLSAVDSRAEGSPQGLWADDCTLVSKATDLDRVPSPGATCLGAGQVRAGFDRQLVPRSNNATVPAQTAAILATM